MCEVNLHIKRICSVGKVAVRCIDIAKAFDFTTFFCIYFGCIVNTLCTLVFVAVHRRTVSVLTLVLAAGNNICPWSGSFRSHIDISDGGCVIAVILVAFKFHHAVEIEQTVLCRIEFHLNICCFAGFQFGNVLCFANKCMRTFVDTIYLYTVVTLCL